MNRDNNVNFTPTLDDYEDYKYKIRPFNLFCAQNFPLIEENFDALTTYQLLCKLNGYLNQIITDLNITEDNMNTQNNNIKMLLNAYNELQSYVNTYFDNLDVQEEINNKLDEMAASGVLEDILLHYTNTVKIYNSTIEMINDYNNLVNNQKVQTLGYYEENDGGGAFYLISNNKNNKFHQIALENGLFANLIINNVVYLKQFGAYGDNIHDDTLFVQQFFDFISFNSEYPNRLKGIINTGFYKITDNIILSRCSVEGLSSSTFVCASNCGLILKNIENDNFVYETFLKNFGITGNNNNIGLKIQNGSQIYLDTLTIFNCNIGLKIENTDISHIIRPTIQNCNTGLALSEVRSSSFTNGNFFNNVKDIAFHGSGGGLNFDNNYFENSSNAIYFESNNEKIDYNLLNFTNNSFNSNTSKGYANGYFLRIICNNSYRISLTPLIFKGNRFFQGTTTIRHPLLIDLLNNSSSPVINMILEDNYFVNNSFINEAVIECTAPSSNQVRIKQKDNIIGGNAKSLITADSKAWISGFNPPLANYSYINQLVGQLVLDSAKNDNPTNVKGAILYDAYSNKLKYYDGSSYKTIAVET